MLILSRYQGQKIILDGLIEINVINIDKRNAVAIGIRAPKAVPVHREEIHKKVKESKTDVVEFKMATKGFEPKDMPEGYLILNRHANQKIKICDDVTITLLSVDKRAAKIGIDAPTDVSIHREEIQNRINAGEPKPE